MATRLYERIGGGYARTRRADPRIEGVVRAALGDARTVVNVGAGAGSYEPTDRRVVAVEPSPLMRAQRPAGSAPCLAAAAENLPLADATADVAMALYTDFHWRDRRRGIAELLRVSRNGIVILTVDRDVAERYWLTRDYLPAANELFAPLAAVTSLLPGPRPTVTPVPIPADCRDGFVHAFWKRPEALLDPAVHGLMAVFARIPPADVADGLSRLRADLASGGWQRRNRELAALEALDLGHRLVIWRPEPTSGQSASPAHLSCG
ncbi:MAG TPA: methyltransferase domain-containing protein [Solirubrobacteraceae bacterium]|jgi:SAM-dependent methyltransferase|nr:methyltransferase domain-containing protein [Solirubrobacteraceae bacterium]